MRKRTLGHLPHVMGSGDEQNESDQPDRLTKWAREIKARGMASIINCQIAADELFKDIEEHHGEEEARRIFAAWGRRPSQRELNTRRDRLILCRILEMPERNIHKLALELARENETLPRKERHGPSGSTDPTTIEKYLRRVFKNHWTG